MWYWICGIGCGIGKFIGIVALRKGPVQKINNTTLTAKAEYSMNFNEKQKVIVFSVHSNDSNGCFC